MENLVVEEIGLIKEETYQKIKRDLNKTNDYFSIEELQYLTRQLKE